ncbi:MAG: DMT family transporter [Acidobacteria bacterium]|nr:DMT family transporter [Acidobacteriota bacterium]
MSQSPSTKSGIQTLAMSAFMFSLMSLGVKLAGRHLPSQQIVVIRTIISFILSFILIWRAGIPIWGTNKKLLFLRGFFGFCGLDCFFYSLSQLPIAEATVLQYTSPIWTALLAALVLKERISPSLLLSIGLCLVGLVCVTRPPFLFGQTATRVPTYAYLVGFAGAFFSACAYVTVRHLSKLEHELVIVFYFPMVALPFSIPTVFPIKVIPTAMDLLIVLGVGICAQIAQVYLTRGMKFLQAGRSAAVLYLQIVFAAAWGILFFQEVPTPWTIFGAIFILCGTILASMPPEKEVSATGA